ncbi:MAG: SDR family NAD(P)-dependent oxidoreductase [Pseudomonadales bacterium]
MKNQRTALITGASAGLGVEFARQLAARGFDLVLVARRQSKLDEVADAIRQQHDVAVTVLQADLADPDAPQALQRALTERQIHVDYLVNNAGAAGPDLLDERDWEAQRRYQELMINSVAHMCHLFVPAMRERGWGRVINVSSMSGRLARAGDINYGPAKAYVIALSEALSVTLRKTGVHVCALCPGFTHTDFHEVAGMLDMKRQTPKFLWYDADVVVREGIKAVERGTPIRASGRLYRWLDPLFQARLTRRLFR